MDFILVCLFRDMVGRIQVLVIQGVRTRGRSVLRVVCRKRIGYRRLYVIDVK